MMTGALQDDQPEPARVTRLENRDGNGSRDLPGGDGQAEQGTKPKKKRTEREERMDKLLKTASWLIFCCGLCEDWDLAADSHQNGTQNTESRDGERR